MAHLRKEKKKNVAQLSLPLGWLFEQRGTNTEKLNEKVSLKCADTIKNFNNDSKFRKRTIFDEENPSSSSSLVQSWCMQQKLQKLNSKIKAK